MALVELGGSPIKCSFFCDLGADVDFTRSSLLALGVPPDLPTLRPSSFNFTSRLFTFRQYVPLSQGSAAGTQKLQAFISLP